MKNANEKINQLLKLELERRMKIAGIEIEDVRITDISYGREIEKVMLQKQAVDVAIVAKERIALVAVNIIEKSFKKLKDKKDNEEKTTKFVTKLTIMLNIEGNEIGPMIIKIG